MWALDYTDNIWRVCLFNIFFLESLLANDLVMLRGESVRLWSVMVISCVLVYLLFAHTG